MRQSKNPNLGDLVNLDGLEKPGEGVAKFVLGGKPEKTKKLGEEMGDVAGKIEDHSDVNAGEVAGLVELMKKALVKELSPEKAAEILKTLKTRFLKKKKPYKSPEGIKWEAVQAKLEANPSKLWSLNEMEKTGGKPDVLEQDGKTGEYIFIDCSAESPTGRRNCVYDKEGEETLKSDPDEKCEGNAVSRAALMGINLLSASEYRKLQTKGEFDKQSWSWLKTPLDKRKAGVVLYGLRRQGHVLVRENVSDDHGGTGAFRGVLRV